MLMRKEKLNHSYVDDGKVIWVQPYWKDGIFLKKTTTTTLNISPSNCPFWAFIPERKKNLCPQNPVQKCSQ